jgi:translation initiation factor 4E
MNNQNNKNSSKEQQSTGDTPTSTSKENNKENSSPLLNTLQSNNPLEYAYSFWFSKRPGKGSAAIAAASSAATSSSSNINYDANLRLVGTFNTVEKFWSYYSHMTRPHDLMGHADIHLFKDGIRPLWEDDANKNGGKWIVRLKKGLANRCWENLILAILGEQFMVGEEICGAVVSVRFQVSSSD